MIDAAIDEHLGRQLRRRRRTLGLTQQALGAAAGLSFQQIQKYECAANRMSAAIVWRLAQVLAVPVEYFYDGMGGAPTSLGEDRKSFTSDETRDLIRAYSRLRENPRRKLLDLAKSLSGDGAGG